jgi:Tol biopolymer transport system component
MNQPTMHTQQPDEQRLESWKEIAAYLQRNAVTVRRWEKEEGLPVHRHSHKSRSSVYAYPSEIERWRASRKVVAEQAPPTPLWRRIVTPSFALTMLLSLVMVGNGVRPEVVSAQQGGESRMLVCSGPECDQGQISPDGKSLLARIDGSLAIRDLATKKVRTLVPSPSDAFLLGWSFSADGSQVSYSRRPAQGSQAERSAAEEVEIVSASRGGSNAPYRALYRGGYPLAWSPDGRRLLIGESGATIRMAWVDVSTGSVQPLAGDYVDVGAAIVSPDGRFIAFTAAHDRVSPNDVYLVASDGSGETHVFASTTNQRPVAWTRDGKNLLYALSGPSVTLWSVPVANGKVQGPAINTRVDLPNGGFLGVSRSGALYYRIRSNPMDIYTAAMDPASGKVTAEPAPVPLDSIGHNDGPRWAPDSRHLVYFRPGGEVREWHLYSTETGKDERLAMHAQNIRGYCWSRGGASILFNRTAGAQPGPSRFDLADGRITPLFPAAPPFLIASCAGDLVVGGNPTGIQVRNLVNGSAKDVFTAPPNNPGEAGQSAVISHDGRNVAFMTPGIIGAAAQAPGAIHVVSSDGGPVRDLATATAPAELQLAFGQAWSPDDRFVYFARRPNSQTPFELFRVPAAGGTAESAGLKVADMRAIDIAPDGTRIAFVVGAITPEIWKVEGFLPGKK